MIAKKRRAQRSPSFAHRMRQRFPRTPSRWACRSQTWFTPPQARLSSFTACGNQPPPKEAGTLVPVLFSLILQQNRGREETGFSPCRKTNFFHCPRSRSKAVRESLFYELFDGLQVFCTVTFCVDDSNDPMQDKDEQCADIPVVTYIDVSGVDIISDSCLQSA